MPRKPKNNSSNSGTLRRRKDGRWEVRLTVGTKPDGSARQRSFYARTKKAAQKLLTEQRQKLLGGDLLDPSSVTVTELIDQHIGWRANIQEESRYKLKREALPIKAELGRKRVQELTRPQVRQALANLANQGYSVRAQQRTLRLLRASLEEAADDEIIRRNVASTVTVSAPRISDTDRTAQVWTDVECALFLERARGEVIPVHSGGQKAKLAKKSGLKPDLVRVSAEEAVPHPLYGAFYLMIYFGLRRGEALGLPWSNVDFDAALITIDQSLTAAQKSGSFELKPVKTSSSRRTIRIDDEAISVLKMQLAAQERLKQVLQGSWEDHGLVFTTELGTPCDPRNALRAFKSLIAPLPVKDIRIHDLRHTNASMSLRAGIPVEVVANRLGHAKPTTTMDIYRHLYPKEANSAPTIAELQRARKNNS